MDLRSVLTEIHAVFDEAGIGPARIGALRVLCVGPSVGRTPGRGDDFRI